MQSLDCSIVFSRFEIKFGLILVVEIPKKLIPILVVKKLPKGIGHCLSLLGQNACSLPTQLYQPLFELMVVLRIASTVPG